jgi:hypothetical protein
LRGVDSFAELWQRRTTLQIPGGKKCDLLPLRDLVQAKNRRYWLPLKKEPEKFRQGA